jgi:hypothetical protein
MNEVKNGFQPTQEKPTMQTMPVKFDDVVNHPSHYCTGKFECIEVMTEVFGKEAVQAFCRCNAFKYLYRSDRKNGIEDIKKARWYINKFIDLEEELKNEKNTDTV